MQTLVLYRFHKDVEILREHVRIIRHLNPGLRIHWIYSGSGAPEAKRTLGDLFDSFYAKGPGLALPRVFLPKFADEDIPIALLEKVHCEITIPGYAEAFGLAIAESGFYRNWHAKVPTNLTSPLFTPRPAERCLSICWHKRWRSRYNSVVAPSIR